MSNIGQPECATQNRAIALFRDERAYRYLGDWTDRPNNSNIEDALLTAARLQPGADQPGARPAGHQGTPKVRVSILLRYENNADSGPWSVGRL